MDAYQHSVLDFSPGYGAARRKFGVPHGLPYLLAACGLCSAWEVGAYMGCGWFSMPQLFSCIEGHKVRPAMGEWAVFRVTPGTEGPAGHPLPGYVWEGKAGGQMVADSWEGWQEMTDDGISCLTGAAIHYNPVEADSIFPGGEGTEGKP